MSGRQFSDGVAKQDANCDNPLPKCARPGQKPLRQSADLPKPIYLKNDRYMSKKDKRQREGGIMAAP